MFSECLPKKFGDVNLSTFFFIWDTATGLLDVLLRIGGFQLLSFSGQMSCDL